MKGNFNWMVIIIDVEWLLQTGKRALRTHPSSRVNYAEDLGGKKVNISKDAKLPINEGLTEMMCKLFLQQIQILKSIHLMVPH